MLALINAFGKRPRVTARARLHAWFAARDADNRGDTRDKHRTRQALQSATTAQLERELGWR